MTPNPDWRLSYELGAQWDLGQRESILKRAVGEAVNTVRTLVSGNTQSDGPAPISDFVNLDFLVDQAEREYRDFVVDESDLISNTHMDYYSANLNLTPNSDSARFQSDYMQQVFAKIDGLAEAAGVPLVFMFIPHPFDVTESYDDWQLDRHRFPNYDSRNQIRVLEDAARQMDAPFLSLYDRFRSTDANELYFHGGDDHWNRKGQLLAAQMMAEHLRALGLLHP
jgi:hypothetical protein